MGRAAGADDGGRIARTLTDFLMDHSESERWEDAPDATALAFEVGCFGSVHVNQLTDSGIKNQKNQFKLIPLIPLYFT